MDKILLIEDEVLILRMYEKIFSYEGFTVITSENGIDGMEKAKAEKPSLILLDIMMPKMDGLRVLESLKQDPETRDIPVVILTNLSSDVVIKDAFSKGAAGYLVKSEIINDKIVEEVKQYIKQ
ncbi:response regulator [candidate division WWE3 bacterium]|jgi:CheY-like chemotaxis protein|uniref:Response regulator n=1 Tax=candidate division WWE3 bacterium TaxID=2053526 RepID=A0A3A4ZFE3_UNCKA|nr:MAG: response regulator [candidate division WWE3 bacterium]